MTVRVEAFAAARAVTTALLHGLGNIHKSNLYRIFLQHKWEMLPLVVQGKLAAIAAHGFECMASYHCVSLMNLV